HCLPTRRSSDLIIAHTDFDKMHIAGQTAAQLDVKEMNDRDTIVLFAAVTILLIIVLVFQTKSIILPFLMMGTILLSYFASMGFSRSEERRVGEECSLGCVE